MYCWCKNKKYISKGKAFPVFLLLLFGKVSISLYFCELKIIIDSKMRMNTIVKSFILLCMLLWNYHATAQEVWELVTDYSNLSTDDTYVIAGNHMENKNTWLTLRNKRITYSNRTELPIGSILTISNNRITSFISNDETWKLEPTDENGVFYIKSTAGDYYLHAYSSPPGYIDYKRNGEDSYSKWRIHYEGRKEGTSHVVTGLYNIGRSRMLAVFISSSNELSWRSYGSNNYNNISGEEVVLFRKKTTESASISSAEYATFSSPDALDFSAESGLTVYTAAVNEAKTKVILREVTSKRVPANTAVVLHGAAGSYTGRIIADADAITGNDLQIASEAMTGNGKIYVLNRVDGVVGFYKLKSSGTLAKGKAYITLEGNTGAPMLSMSEDSEVTAIEMLPTDACQYQKGYYTLDGRRVERPTKGVYVMDGRKIVVK